MFSQISSTVEMVSPDLATKWLADNLNNRRVRLDKVAEYAASMKADRWHFTGEAIKFDSSGVLRDGQHRLHAIIESGKTLPVLVVRGLQPEAQAAMDSGLKRSAADALDSFGATESLANVVAAVARFILTDCDRSVRSVSAVEILNLINADASIRASVREVPILNRGMATRPVMAYAFWRLSQVDPVAAKQFFTSLATKTDLPAGSPILALDNRLVSERASRRSRTRQEALACIFSMWNAWRRGEYRASTKVPRTKEGKLIIHEPI